MAILHSLPGVEVNVCVGRVPLKEYDDDEVNQTLGEDAFRLGPATVSKYIEAVTDREFTVDLCVKRPYTKTSPTLTFDVYVDGHWATGKVIETPTVTSHIPIQRSVDGALSYNATTGEGKVHHFKFSSIKTTSSEEKASDIKEDSKRMSKVGMIEVKVFRTSMITTVPRGDRPAKLDLSATEVHEKALKGQAKSHGVSSARTTANDFRTASHVDYLDGTKSPVANFIFQYRSEDALKSLYIIKRTPSPEPVAAVPPPVIPRVKRERDNGENIKPEPRAKRSKYTITIDLTADSSDDDSIITLD